MLHFMWQKGAVRRWIVEVVRRGRLPEESAEDLISEVCEDRLRMHLDTLHREAPVPDAHQDTLGCVRRGSEHVGEIGQNQRVVAAGNERCLEGPIDALSVVVHERATAVDRSRGADDAGAVRGPDALVAEADPQYGQVGADRLDDGDTSARVLGPSRAR